MTQTSPPKSPRASPFDKDRSTFEEPKDVKSPNSSGNSP